MKNSDVSQSALSTLTDCLEKVPFLQINQSYLPTLDHRADIILDVSIQGVDYHLFVQIKSNGQPRMARQAVYQFKDFLAQEQSGYGIFFAPFISDEAGKICEEAGVGYMDMAGNCLITFGTVYIRRSGTRNPSPQRRDLRSLYSPKGERILRVFLDHPKVTWRMADLAKAANVSLGQVANIKKLLLDREWLRDTAEGILLTSPASLLDEWSQTYRFQRSAMIECYALAEISEIEAQVAEKCVEMGFRYALSGFSSAARFAPMVRYQKASAYITGDIQAIIHALGWKAVQSGANITLLAPYDDGVFYRIQTVDEMTITSPLQTYLDLQHQRGRGQEAAQAVRTTLEKTW